MNRRLILWVPLILVALLGGFMLRQLSQPRDEFVHSQLIGKKLPGFALGPAFDGALGVSSKNMADGKPRLLNIFASWCIPCQAEAPQLDMLAKAGVEIDAIAVRDKPEDVRTFLKQYGNPYARIGTDPEMHMQVLLGSTGVPETYVIGGDGTIIYQHIGDIREEHVPMLLKKIEEAAR